MAVAIGANTLTAIARHHIIPVITDNVYQSNVLLWRWIKNNKRVIQGGTQVEVPLMFQRFSNGGSFRGFQILNVTPSDTIKNGALDWKQYYVSYAIDSLTLLKADSELAIANILAVQGQQAYMEMAENLAVGLFGTTVNMTNHTPDPTGIDGLAGAIGTNAVGDASYAGIPRSTNPWWNAQTSGITTVSSMADYQAMFSQCTVGGQSPTLIVSGTDQYNKYLALQAQSSGVGYGVQYNREPGGHDVLLASAGFTNAMYNNTPWVTDSHVTPAGDADTQRIYMLNENVWQWVVSPRADFYIEDFQKPHNQSAFSTTMEFAGNAICMSPRLNGVFNALTS
jgi:hypothetical protein